MSVWRCVSVTRMRAAVGILAQVCDVSTPGGVGAKALDSVSVPWFSAWKNKAMIQALDSELDELETDAFLSLRVYFILNGIYTGIAYCRRNARTT